MLGFFLQDSVLLRDENLNSALVGVASVSRLNPILCSLSSSFTDEEGKCVLKFLIIIITMMTISMVM